MLVITSFVPPKTAHHKILELISCLGNSESNSRKRCIHKCPQYKHVNFFEHANFIIEVGTWQYRFSEFSLCWFWTWGGYQCFPVSLHIMSVSGSKYFAWICPWFCFEIWASSHHFYACPRHWWWWLSRQESSIHLSSLRWGSLLGAFWLPFWGTFLQLTQTFHMVIATLQIMRMKAAKPFDLRLKFCHTFCTEYVCVGAVVCACTDVHVSNKAISKQERKKIVPDL